jgi:hypothetical protein
MALQVSKDKRVYAFTDNNGGMNTRGSLFKTAPDQAREARNILFPKTGGWSVRRGQAKTTTNAAFGGKIWHSFEFVRGGVRKKMGFGSDGKLYDFSTDPPTVVGTGFSTNRPPDTAVYRGWLLICDGETQPRKWDMTNLFPWGIPKPASAPTLAAGAAGSPNGSYRFRTAYSRDPSGIDPGAKGSMGPIAGPITLTNQKGELTNIANSADTQVTTIFIYVEIAGQWYEVGSIANGSTAFTYDMTDSAAAELGVVGRTDRDPPPASIRMAELHKDVIFASDNQFLYHTILAEFEAFSVTARKSAAFQADDGYKITCLRSADDLIVGKERSIYLRSGDDVTFSIRKAVGTIGILGRRSCVIDGNVARFFSHKGFVEWDFTNLQIISNNIGDLVIGDAAEKLIYSNDVERIIGAVYSNNRINATVWAIPTTNLASGGALLYHPDFRTIDSSSDEQTPSYIGSWTHWDNLDAFSLFVAPNSATLLDELYSGTSNGFLRKIDTGSNDVGSSYTWEYTQTDQYFDDPFAHRRLRDAYFAVVAGTTSTPTVEWIINGLPSGNTTVLNFSSALSIFDVAVFDVSVFSAESPSVFIAVAGYSSDPFRTIAPKLTGTVNADDDIVNFLGWVLRQIPAGYRRSSQVS